MGISFQLALMCLGMHVHVHVCRRLSDRDQDNALSRDEFCIAMKLVLMRRKGLPIPASLPEPLSSLGLGRSCAQPGVYTKLGHMAGGDMVLYMPTIYFDLSE